MSRDVLEKQSGRVTDVVRKTYGANLTAAAAIADTVLNVTSVDDFDATEGGQVLINGELYDYITVDEDALTITLDTGLLDAAGEDDLVELYDPEVEGIVVEYVANVLLDDQDPGDEPIEVTVQHGLVNMLTEAVRGRAAESVVLIRDGDDDWVIWQIDGKLAVDVVIEALQGGYPGTLQDIFDAADAAAEAAADAAANATTAMTAANGKNKVTVSLLSPGSTANSAGDIWFRKESATQTVIEQWEGQGGTSWNQVTLNDQVIANLDAGKIVAGSAFTNALSVKTNFTLGDASTNGVIQSYNFAGSSVGIYIDKFGIAAKGGTISAVDITGSTFTASGGSVTALLSGSSSPAGSAALSFTGSGFSHSVYSNSGALTAYSNNELVLTAPTVGIYGTVEQSGTSFLGSIDVAGEVHSSSSFFDDSLAGGGGTGANINNNGKIIRTPPSSRRFKKDIRPHYIDRRALANLRLMSFLYKDPEKHGEGRFVDLIAEDLVAAGLEEIVTYDGQGRVNGYHRDRLALVLLPFVVDLLARVETLGV